MWEVEVGWKNFDGPTFLRAKGMECLLTGDQEMQNDHATPGAEAMTSEGASYALGGGGGSHKT